MINKSLALKVQKKACSDMCTILFKIIKERKILYLGQIENPPQIEKRHTIDVKKPDKKGEKERRKK